MTDSVWISDAEVGASYVVRFVSSTHMHARPPDPFLLTLSLLPQSYIQTSLNGSRSSNALAYIWIQIELSYSTRQDFRCRKVRRKYNKSMTSSQETKGKPCVSMMVVYLSSLMLDFLQETPVVRALPSDVDGKSRMKDVIRLMLRENKERRSYPCLPFELIVLRMHCWRWRGVSSSNQYRRDDFRGSS